MLRRLCRSTSLVLAPMLVAVACAPAPARSPAPEAARPSLAARAPEPPARRAPPAPAAVRTAQTRAPSPQPAPPRAPSTAAPAAERSAGAAGPPAPSPVPAALTGVAAPVWHIGDQWAFRWESSEGQGEYVWTVARTEVVDGVEEYVVTSGPREIHYRARDLATTLETLAGVVEVRHVPPRTGFSWPLTPGTIWQETYTEEHGSDRVPLERTIAWQVEAEERLSVEAGTFDTLKIVAHHDRYASPDVMYAMWYAPAAKQFVRLEEHFPTGIRYRELTDFTLG